VSDLPLVWTAPILERSGYGAEARNYILALDEYGVDVRADPLPRAGWRHRPAFGQAERIEHLLAEPFPGRHVHVMHLAAPAYHRRPGAVRTIGRTMFETEGLPANWIERCNAIDEVWVPSEFNLETFARAGVDTGRLHKVHECLQLELYHDGVEPIELPGASGFVFLAVFGWARRKGWDVLVRAYVEEFATDEDVTLALLVVPVFAPIGDILDELRAFIRSEVDCEPERTARIIVLDVDPGTEGMPGLYRAASAYVLPSRGEGWGRPYMEAMAMGLPAIATGWSGNLEFMSEENAYLVDYEISDVSEAAWREFPFFRGERWAEPSVTDLRRVMRRVLERPDEARVKGERARTDVRARFGWETVAASIAERLEAPRRRARTADEVSLTWSGPLFGEGHEAAVNRALCRALIGAQAVRLALEAEDEPAPEDAADPHRATLVALASEEPRSTALSVCHSFPPPLSASVIFLSRDVPSVEDWVPALADAVDELWVSSASLRDRSIVAGADPTRLAVVPLGVDPVRFHPNLPGERAEGRLRILAHVGARGRDAALAAYGMAFGSSDSAELVPLAVAQREGHTYLACDCFLCLDPGELGALTIAEAMACGLPVIAAAAGACLEVCDDSTAYLVPLDDAAAAAAALRRIAAGSDEARALGLRASERVLRERTWRVTATVVAERAAALARR